MINSRTDEAAARDSARAGWTLAADQSGTVVADLAAADLVRRLAVDAPDAPRPFTARLVDHTGQGTLSDGSVLWEVVAGDDERVADCTNEDAARALERVLNAEIAVWIAGDVDDRTTG